MNHSSKSSVRRVLVLYSAFQLFFGLLLWLPIFFEYQKQLGLSSEQIFSIQSIYYVAFCLVEVPTGMLADRWGRRRCLRLGSVSLVVANLLPIALPNYAGFLVHFLLIALSRSFISGASSAWLYDYLKATGAADEVYKQAEGRARAYSLVAKVVCWPAVGLLMQLHAPLPYWLSAASAGVAVFLAALLPAMPAGSTSASSAARKQGRSLAETLRLLVASPLLPLLMLQGVALFVLARIATVNLFNPILEAKSFGVAQYGMVMSAMTVFEAAGSYWPRWLRRWVNDLNAVFLLTVVMAVSLGAVVVLGPVGTLVALCVFSLAIGLSFPIQRQLMNDAIVDSRYRATLLSFESILDRAVNALVAMVLANQLTTGGLDRFLVVSAGATLASVMLLMGGLRYLSSSRPAGGDLQTR